MKKALLPLLFILLAIVVLALAGYLYDKKYGTEGPFPSQHHHGGGGEEEHHHDASEPEDHHDHDAHTD